MIIPLCRFPFPHQPISIKLFWYLHLYFNPGGYSLCDGWYICAAVFFTLAGSSTIFLGYFFSSTNSKAIFWGTKTTNFYKNRSFWPQIQFFPRSFWVQFSAASGTPPSIFRMWKLALFWKTKISNFAIVVDRHLSLNFYAFPIFTSRGGYSSSSRAGRLGRTLWPQNSTSVAETEKGGQNSTMTPPPQR